MSLDNKLIKQHTDPLSKELDRQKEKAAFWKNKAKKAQKILDKINFDASASELISGITAAQVELEKLPVERKKKGLGALLGQWPGEETIEQLQDQLKKGK